MKNNPRIIALLILSIFAVLMAISVFSGCTCEGRLARIKKNCPDLLKKDTLTIRDTFFTKEVHKDTVFKFSSTSDTVILKKDNMMIKYFYNTKDSTVYIKGQCDTIRVIRELHVPYEKIVYKETFSSLLKQYWYVFLAAIAVILGIRFVMRK